MHVRSAFASLVCGNCTEYQQQQHQKPSYPYSYECFSNYVMSNVESQRIKNARTDNRLPFSNNRRMQMTKDISLVNSTTLAVQVAFVNLRRTNYGENSSHNSSRPTSFDGGVRRPISPQSSSLLPRTHLHQL
ncbi:hypothetical protein KQX54_021405 [Cotesia glomerata]|uniref:Uncharacterized protein n=1 Tax=Cotesia glomerata TaxID=32391 RepID=A0AAV7J6R6_COTGL|nr:hypothetical protein KQX54_021405 [Cotesia glomerata]